MKAIWNGTTIAQSPYALEVDGRYYFPPESVNQALLVDSSTRSACGRKGDANYFHIVVNGKVNRDGAFFYPEPGEAVQEIRNYVCFWHGVELVPDVERVWSAEAAGL